VLLALLALVAAGWWGERKWASSTAGIPISTATSTASAAKPVEVELATVQTASIPHYLLATGELRADKEAAVAPDAAGKVVAAPIERGMSFEAGQVLMQLDDRAAKLALREAEANVALALSRFELAKSDVERNQPLAEAHAIAASDLQHLQADLKAREAELQLARARLDTASKAVDDTTIRAPFRGTVAERLVQVGEYVRADSAVVKLVDVRRLRLVLNIPEPSAGSIKRDQDVVFSVSTFPGREFAGKVTQIGPALRSASRDLVIEVTVENPDGQLRAGTFASAKVRLTEAPAVVIPSAAIKRQGEVARVYAVHDGRAVEKLLELGESSPAGVEVRKGLAAGESVVLSPGDLADGTSVTTKGVR
jgi:RND family efflux transporter MFP subunit